MIEDLLKKTLPDDLPPEVAAGMRDRLDRFREQRTGRDRRPSSLFPFLVPRGAWASVSLMMLVSGGFLQALGARSPVADRLSAIRTSEVVARRLAAAASMSGSVRILRDDGGVLVYDLLWSREGGSLVSGERPDRPPVTALLDPSSLAAILSGEWGFITFGQEGGRETGIYSVRSPDGRLVLEPEVDLGTFFPVRITGKANLPAGAEDAGKPLWEARYKF
jgi:hypothetical protein